MAKVSIIVPLYNKAPYVAKALKSIASQTYTDWECIIVNDGSTDNSLEVVDAWLKENIDENWCSIGEHWRLITQENAGVSAARNHGISLSTGDFVAFLDADDWWAPTFLEEMVKFAEEYPEAGLYASNYIYYKPGKTRVGVKTNVIEDCNSPYINYPKAYYENEEQVVWTGAAMIPKKTIEHIEDRKIEQKHEKKKIKEVFPVGITLGEDFLLWGRIALQYKVAFLNKPLAYYNNDIPASLRLTRHLHATETHMLWHLDSIDDFLLMIDDCELKKDWKRLLDKLRVNGLMEYWMSDAYHDVAAKELKKVTGELPKAYKLPIRWLRAKKCIMSVGSYCKQLIIRK